MFLIAVTSFEYDEDSSSKTYFHFGGCDESGSEKEKFFFLRSMHENMKSRITFFHEIKEVLVADLNSAALNRLLTSCTMQIEVTA